MREQTATFFKVSSDVQDLPRILVETASYMIPQRHDQLLALVIGVHMQSRRPAIHLDTAKFEVGTLLPCIPAEQPCQLWEFPGVQAARVAALEIIVNNP